MGDWRAFARSSLTMPTACGRCSAAWVARASTTASSATRRDVSDEEIEYFSTVDYDDRMAFVAEIGHDIAAIGRYDRMEDDPSSAEVAFSVDDAHHGRGLGSHLLSHLTNYARNNGVSAFRAFVLPENYPMMRLFRGSGYRMKRGMGEGVYEVEFPVERSEEALAVEGAHEQKSVAASLLPIFYPRSVAIIGASREHHTIGGRVMRNVLDAHFNGAVFPVNPNAPAVGSVKAYRSVLDIPDPIDVAVIVVPSRFVIPVVEECAKKGVKGLVVISAGFSETGEAGAAMEQELLDLVRVSGMRMIGPNCMGMLNTDPAVNLDLTFAPTYPPRGNVAMSSQSGALGIAILDYADQLEIGISSFVSVGNSADVSANDLLLYWEGDPSTDVILLYVESFGQPRRFSRVARRIGKSKPIIAVKSGRTSPLVPVPPAATPALWRASRWPCPPCSASPASSGSTPWSRCSKRRRCWPTSHCPNGRRVAVLTNAGGPGILCVDALESEGLEVPEFSPGTPGQAPGASLLGCCRAESGRHDRIGGTRPVRGLPRRRCSPATRSIRSSSSSSPPLPVRSLPDLRCGPACRRRGHQRQDAVDGLHGGQCRRDPRHPRMAGSVCPPTRSRNPQPGPWRGRPGTASGGNGPPGSSWSSTTSTRRPLRRSSGRHCPDWGQMAVGWSQTRQKPF